MITASVVGLLGSVMVALIGLGAIVATMFHSRHCHQGAGMRQLWVLAVTWGATSLTVAAAWAGQLGALLHW